MKPNPRLPAKHVSRQGNVEAIRTHGGRDRGTEEARGARDGHVID